MDENEDNIKEIKQIDENTKEIIYKTPLDTNINMKHYYTKTIKFYNEDILKAKHLFDLVFYLQKQLNEKYFSSFFLKIMNEGIKEICKENNIDYQKILNELFSIQNIL